jgi:acetylornithine deacetylase/succinyl-diaminopimelate desuccinylase-like protein
MLSEDVRPFIDATWADDVLPVLSDYIRIPNVSPAFDPAWAEHGHMDRAVELLEGWARSRAVAGLTVEVVRLDGRTPVILMEVPPTGGDTGGSEPPDTVLLYGHLDKQPEMVGWRPGLGPWEPVLDGERLYGRGGADDGYSTFCALTAIEAVQRHGGAHRRCVVLIEACEESGSYDLPAYVDALADRLGRVSLVVCLDSGCGTYDRVWTTTSLRGLAGFTLTVRVLEEGIHSGASGIVPSTFRIAREVLNRLEDPVTGAVLLPEFSVAIPAERVEQAKAAAAVLGDEVGGRFPLLPGVRPVTDDPAELLLNATWRPAVEVIGADGLPPIDQAGNVLRPVTALNVSVRLPPTCDATAALAAARTALTEDPPYGAAVTVEGDWAATGWAAPPTAPWLEAAVADASQRAFGQPPGAMGEGGTIPFMGMLGERFPEAQFLVLGVLGPGSNAHGPNEFLDLPMARGLTESVAHVLTAYAES